MFNSVLFFVILKHLVAFPGDYLYLNQSEADTACTCECKCRNNWPWARAPVNTHPAQTHTRTLTVTKVNKWQSDGNYGPWWNNQHNGWAAPMFSLIKANSHPNQTITHRVSAGARVSTGRSECIYGHWGSLWKHSCGAACNKPTAHSHDMFRFVLNGSKSSLLKSLLLLSLEGKDACGGRYHQLWYTICSDSFVSTSKCRNLCVLCVTQPFNTDSSKQ